MSSENDRYAQAGVSYAAIDPGKLLAQRAAALTAAALPARGFHELAESRGESAYVVDFGDRYVSSVTEALGTKALVADAVRPLSGRTHYDAIAQDTVATILNDLATLGGKAVNIAAYWGAGSSAWFEDSARMADLVAGWAAACQQARCAWGGGETQVLVGVIEPGAVVLGGSAVGSIAKDELLLGSRVAAGDAILLARSTGIHANGLTLARKIAESLAASYATPVPGDARGRGYGEVLLDPAPLYGPLIEALQVARVPLHYAAHITGHGWRKLMRPSQSLSYLIERVPEPNPIDRFLMQAAQMSEAEAYGTFNMGAGFALYLPRAAAEQALEVAARAGFALLDAGRVEAGVKQVVIQPVGVRFAADSLAIR
ncbi:MAG TPA: AIR synthase related protein [Polyangiaceae bacterium]